MRMRVRQQQPNNTTTLTHILIFLLFFFLIPSMADMSLHRYTHEKFSVSKEYISSASIREDCCKGLTPSRPIEVSAIKDDYGFIKEKGGHSGHPQ